MSRINLSLTTTVPVTLPAVNIQCNPDLRSEVTGEGIYYVVAFLCCSIQLFFSCPSSLELLYICLFFCLSSVMTDGSGLISNDLMTECIRQFYAAKNIDVIEKHCRLFFFVHYVLLLVFVLLLYFFFRLLLCLCFFVLLLPLA